VHVARINGLQIKDSVVLNGASGFVFANRPARLIIGGSSPDVVEPGPKPATARVPAAPPFMAYPPSVNVGNADRFARVAHLSGGPRTTQDVGPSPKMRRLTRNGGSDSDAGAMRSPAISRSSQRTTDDGRKGRHRLRHDRCTATITWPILVTKEARILNGARTRRAK
jgi:hypothetical protein